MNRELAALLIGVLAVAVASLRIAGVSGLLDPGPDDRAPATILIAGLALVGGMSWRLYGRRGHNRDDASGGRRPAPQEAQLDERAELRRIHREMEARLAMAESRLHDIAEAAGEWIWETDAEHSFTCVYGLPNAITDIDARALLGRNFGLMAQSPGAASAIRQIYEECVSKHQAFRGVRCQVFGLTGAVHHLRVSGKPVFDGDGRFNGYRGMAVEVTAEVEAENRLAEARRQTVEALQAARASAEEANQSKTRFLAAASHDLRQPLQALGLFVATLAHQPMSDDLRGIVDKIETSVEALEHLLDTLLDISRIDAGVVEAHVVVFRLQSLFDRLAVEFEPLAESKGLTMRFARTSALVRSDPALLERVLRNLLSNAIRYTAEGGIVTGCRRRDGGYRIEVWDSGQGVPSHQQREIFREFHRLASPSQGRRHGLGLGLAIVERLTLLLGHRIELKSRPGKGSMFAIVIAPATRAPQADDRLEAALTTGLPSNG